MKNRLVISFLIILLLSGLFLLGRFIKRDVIAGSDSSLVNGEKDSINIESYLKEAEAFKLRGSLLEAKEIYLKLMEMSLSSNQINAVQKDLENLNVAILFSGVQIEGSQLYEVLPGDSLSKIAKQFNTTIELIKKANNIKDSVIRPAMKLRVLNGTFSIAVDKSQNILILKYNGTVIKTYSVSTGNNNSTPVGTYKIVTKLTDPVWYKDGKAIPPTSPENILGTRWLGFDLPSYGIHGTIAPEDIGKQITQGCVRMRNEEVEELYSLIPAGTEVVIVD